MANQYTKQFIDIQKIISLYESGMTQREIASALSTTQKVVWGRLRKVGYVCRIAKKRNQWGENNHMWKGQDASYKAFHYRVEHKRGKPKRCEVCRTTDESKSYDWANLTGNYSDVNDYKRMCRSCHRKYDDARRESDVAYATQV